MVLFSTLSLVFGFLGCMSTDPESRIQVYTRASLDLRGYRPSIEEIEQVAKSERHLSQALDQLIEDPLVGSQFASQMAGVWKTEVVEFDHTDHEYAFADETEVFELLTALGQEPLQVLAEITRSDLPYSDVVTANWTMANAAMAEWSPVSYDWTDDTSGWQRVEYTDDRPSAGLLVSNGLWWRYNSTLSNAQRGRANIVSKMLLCNDFLERRIQTDRELNLLDEAGVQEALKSSPTCVSCHVDLDPLASNFWGLYRHFRFSLEEQFSYHPEREMHWIDQTGVAPGYFGSPIASLSQLGDSLAQDPALYTCLVRRSLAQLTQQPVSISDWSIWKPHLSKFVSSGYQIRPLLRSILDDELYRDISKQKIVTADLFAKQIEHLTTYRFQVNSVDGIDTDLFGLRGLFGGRGKDWLSASSAVPTTTFALVVQRISEAAAHHVTHNEQAANHFFQFDFQVMDNRVDSNFNLLFQTVLSREPSAMELAELTALWDEVYEITNQPEAGWQAVLIYLFRHPYFLTY